MFVVVRDDGLDDTPPSEVGVFETKDEAERVVAELSAIIRADDEHFERFGVNCIVGCEAWPDPEDPLALDALQCVLKSGCPRMRNVHVGEVFYGAQKDSGGYEVICDGKCDACIDRHDSSFKIVEKHEPVRCSVDTDYE